MISSISRPAARFALFMFELASSVPVRTRFKLARKLWEENYNGNTVGNMAAVQTCFRSGVRFKVISFDLAVPLIGYLLTFINVHQNMS